MDERNGRAFCRKMSGVKLLTGAAREGASVLSSDVLNDGDASGRGNAE
jgi:hypothetical protein